MRSLLAFVVAAGVVVACGGSSVDTRPTSCANDADCASGQRCTAGGERPTLGISPCAQVVECETGAECRPDEVCAPSWQRQMTYVESCAPRLCALNCSTSRCPPDAECGDDGVCSLTPCDAPGAAACPALWACDPVTAKTASHAPYAGIEGGEQDIERQMARGCVRLPCDAMGGRACAPAWSCEPGATDNPSGCVPGDCTKTRHCSDDTRLVCKDLATHPEAQTPDANGCIARTCDDGKSCGWFTVTGVDVGRCDYGAPEADEYGCVVLPCEVDADCGYEDYVCDPASVLRDLRNCRIRSCTEGKPCGVGLVCAPHADIHGADDCALPENAMTGGTGGGGGSTGGTGGSGGTASGAGGTASLQVPRGECVAR